MQNTGPRGSTPAWLTVHIGDEWLSCASRCPSHQVGQYSWAWAHFMQQMFGVAGRSGARQTTACLATTGGKQYQFHPLSTSWDVLDKPHTSGTPPKGFTHVRGRLFRVPLGKYLQDTFGTHCGLATPDLDFTSSSHSSIL